MDIIFSVFDVATLAMLRNFLLDTEEMGHDLFIATK